MSRRGLTILAVVGAVLAISLVCLMPRLQLTST